MLIPDLKPHLTQAFSPLYTDFIPLCDGNMQACELLANLFHWTEWAEQQPDYRTRCGWIYKTAEHLKTELGMTRRGYQKARACLLDLGVIQYRRGGVHGKMHWLLNVARLAELIYTKVRGLPAPAFKSGEQFDTDGFRLPAFVPLDLWNAYLKMRAEKGKVLTAAQKKNLLKILTGFHKRKLDLSLIITNAINGGWFGFYAPENRPKPAAAKDGNAAMMAEYQKAMAEKAKPPPDPPPRSRNPDNEARRKTLDLLKKR